MGAAPVEAGQLGLQPDRPEHERGRALLHCRVPGLLQPAEQDLRLFALDRPPGRPDGAHPFGDGGPLQQLVAGLARRACGIAGIPRRAGGVAGRGIVAAERLLPQGQRRRRSRRRLRRGFGRVGGQGLGHDGPSLFD